MKWVVAVVAGLVVLALLPTLVALGMLLVHYLQREGPGLVVVLAGASLTVLGSFAATFISGFLWEAPHRRYKPG